MSYLLLDKAATSVTSPMKNPALNQGQVVQNFLADERGGFSLMFGLMLVPLLGFMGIAIDTARLYAVQSQLQQCLDSAVLAGGRSMYLADRDAIIQHYFDQNWSTGRYGAVPSSLTITPDLANGQITVEATADVPLLLMPLLGFNNQTVTSASQINREDSTLEAALVLDVSGSMMDGATQKISALRNASKLLVDILYPNGTDQGLYVSVVPWDHTVNIGTPYEGWLVPGATTVDSTGPLTSMGGGLWQAIYKNPACPHDGNWNGFATTFFDSYVEQRVFTGDFMLYMRSDPYDIQDDLPGSQGFRPFACVKTDLYRAGALVCADYGLNCATTGLNTVRPLSNDPAAIKTHLDALTAEQDGATDSLTGLFWGWMTLSPTWDGQWSGVPAGMPKDYAEPHHFKSVILMTDGLNNNLSSYDPVPAGVPAGYTLNQAATYINTRSVTICNLLKARGVKIYTVGFDLDVLNAGDRTAVEDYLRGCASSPGNFFPAPDAATLTTAFRTIASDLAALRISQ